MSWRQRQRVNCILRPARKQCYEFPTLHSTGVCIGFEFGPRNIVIVRARPFGSSNDHFVMQGRLHDRPRSIYTVSPSLRGLAVGGGVQGLSLGCT